MERWFSQPASQLHQDSTRVALELSQYATANAPAEAESLANSPSVDRALEAGASESLLREIGTRATHLPFVISTGAKRSGEICSSAAPNDPITLEGAFAVVYRNGAAVRPVSTAPR